MSRETLRFYRAIAPFYRRRPKRALLIGLTLLLSVALLAALPLLLKRVTDSALAGGAGPMAVLTSHPVLLLLLCAVAWAASSSMFKYVQGHLNDIISTELRSRLYGVWLRREPSEEDQEIGIIPRLTGDIAQFHLGLELATSALPPAAFQCAAAISLMAWLSPPLFGAAFAGVILIAAAFPFAERRLAELASASQQKFSDAISLAVEVLPETRFVQRFGREDDEIGRFEAEQRELRKRLARLRRLTLIVRACVFTALALSAGCVIALGVGRVHSNDLQAGTLIAFLGLGGVAGASFAIAVDAFTGIAKAAASLRRVTLVEQIRTRPAAAAGGDAEGRVSAGDTGIEMRDALFSYPPRADGSPGFRLGPVTLAIAAGEAVAFVGRTGCGKSTAARLIAGELSPSEGQVFVAGVPAQQLARHGLQGHVAYVPSEPTIFSRSLRENVAYGAPEAGAAEIYGALRGAALADGSGLDSSLAAILFNQGDGLSSGQRQRIALARTFLLRPKVMILDEATAAVDSETEAEIVDYLQRDMSESTRIIVSHRLATVVQSDRIFLFENGAVTETGRHDELVAARGAYFRLFREQIEAGAAKQGGSR